MDLFDLELNENIDELDKELNTYIDKLLDKIDTSELCLLNNMAFMVCIGQIRGIWKQYREQVLKDKESEDE